MGQLKTEMGVDILGTSAILSRRSGRVLDADAEARLPLHYSGVATSIALCMQDVSEPAPVTDPIIENPDSNDSDGSYGDGRSSAPPRPRVKPELLAPAGDRSCLIAAVENGADAFISASSAIMRESAPRISTGRLLPEVMALLASPRRTRLRDAQYAGVSRAS